MNIYFVRHGKTQWNIEHRIQGWSDTPLLEDDDSPEKAASTLKGIKFDYICSSDLPRAITTKKRILNILNLKDDKNEHFEFREVGFGDWEGLDIDFVKNTYPEIWLNYKLYQDDYDASDIIKGFESVKKVRERGFSKINELKEKFGENANILIISHGSFISIMQNTGKKLTEIASIPDNGEVVLLKF